MIGSDHAASGKQCEDWFLVDSIEGSADDSPLIVIAVADGAGSAERAVEGSRLACSRAVLSLKEEAPALDRGRSEQAIRRAFLAVRSEVEQLASREGCPTGSFATTLLVVVLGRTWLGWGQVGDGGIVVRDSDGLSVSHWPEQESINVTDFVTDVGLESTLACGTRTGQIEGVACFTDGVTPLLLDLRERRPGELIFGKLFAACIELSDDGTMDDQLKELLSSSMVNERTTDDKTIVLAARRLAGT